MSEMALVRVAMLLSDGSTSQGGIGSITGYLTRSLAANAPDVRIRTISTRLTSSGLFKHLSIPFSLARFMAIVLSRQIDVVHVNVAPRGSTWRKMLYAAAARALGRITIIHLHGSAYDEYFRALSPARARQVRRFFQSADHVVALSEQWAMFVRGDLQVPAERVSVIPNGVPEPRHLVLPDQKQRDGSDPVRVAFLGIVGHRKGTDVLVEALGILAQRGMNFHATVGGNGEVDAARAHADNRGLANRIKFAGWVDEQAVDQILRAADVFVLPSRAENQPIAILEAMARALPVVATHVGAIPQQVQDGVTGVLVSPGDPENLAAALAELIEDPARRSSMGLAGLKAFREQFSIDACATQFATLYRRLAQGKGS